MRSLEMLVTSGVVRRAEVDPPQHLDECPDIETGQEALVSSMPAVDLNAPSWFTRLFRRRVSSQYTHARHTT